MRKSANSRYQEQQSEEQSSQSSEEEYTGSRKKKKVRVVPRFVKNELDEINTEVIIVNIGRTQYDVVEEVALQLGWEVERSRKSQKWDIMWIDSHIQAHDLFKLNEHQKISHFPAIYVLTRKNFLGRSLMKMSKQFPADYNFFPFTWTLPSQYTELMRYNENLEEGKQQTQYYIFKPQAMAQGKGIKIYQNIQLLDGKNGIVQTYVNNPYLIENLKFDLRIYVLIMGYDPLRIFIYDEGLGRFATEKYHKVGKKNMKDVHMHLTNYALNKNNKNFVFNTSDKDMDKGHKRSLTAIYKYLASKGVDVEGIKKRIDQMIVKTLIVGQPMIAHTYGLAQADTQANDLCFQILGFDVLLNDQLNPIIIEVNHTPSFKTDTPLDKHIKKNLIKDTLKLLNVSVENKKEKIDMKKQFLEKRQQRKLRKMSNQEKQALKKMKNKERQEYQLKNLGNYRKIFPIQEEKYKFQEMIDFSQKIFNEQYGFKNKKSSIQQKKNSQVARPKSFQKNKNKRLNHSPILNEIKKKIDLKDPKTGHNTMGNRSNMEKSVQLRNSSERFPSISLPKNSVKGRNLSGYISSSVKKQSLPQNARIQLQAASISPSKKTHEGKKNILQGLDLLEQKIFNRGNFVSPKILQMGNFSDEPFIVEKSLNNNINPNSFSPTVIHKSAVKNRTIEQIVSESNFPKKKQITSPPKKMTYQFLIQSLSDVKGPAVSSNKTSQDFQIKLKPTNPYN